MRDLFRSDNMGYNRCIIIYGGPKKIRKNYKDYILRKYPEYVTEINEIFSPTKKLGPFTVENKKSALMILMDDQEIQKKGENYIVEELNRLNISDCMHRKPKSLSSGQIERYSLFYDVMKGKQYFLFDDEFVVNHKESWDQAYYFKIASWLRQSKEFYDNSGIVVWITELPIQQFLDSFFKIEASKEIFYEFYTFNNGTLEKQDRYMLFNQYMNLEDYSDESDYYQKDNKCRLHIMDNELDKYDSEHFSVNVSVEFGTFKRDDVFVNLKTFELLKVQSIIDSVGGVYDEYSDNSAEHIRISFERVIPTTDKRNNNVNHYYDPLIKLSNEKIKMIKQNIQKMST